MPNTKTIHVAHLGGIDAAYQMYREYDRNKPTLVLVNAFTTSSELYRDQFESPELTDQFNLVAIELLGHGQTRTAREHWTYWDTAEMNLQVLDALEIDRAFVLGTSQGGWITVQMALLRPEKIVGIIPVGTSMDSESERSRQLKCWDGPTIVAGFVNQWTRSKATPDFEPDNEYCDALIDIGFNECSSGQREFWRTTIKDNYRGDDGRRRLRMAAINLAERGTLHLRLSDIRCPVLWLHGTKDAVYSVANAEEEIKLFNQSPDACLLPVDGGAHFLNSSHPTEVNKAIADFINKYI
ncbi:hypothetical protein N7448_010928 [Penicillium atrosanguineum]|uniref:AB hydrolase-1 domain-containing protein n=1 Tax=Penicillium atrosanguineum TaxID=1132637 RepID=A0A9W9U053_9EURO|nr:CAZyme family GT2 [Penicillium atrosanguineum]KAJ5119222.1 hypothetical protein N7526_010859 [Penicillium atrosanguineum]KAJ5120259.1 hypothetical protein N7448_010928 [Penicillium atrosanguineum]KAJ5297256.1 CAZyme family GT2 [Penicillium atrosanguineum]KAJ5300018.1 hypothetical protein N7476_011575 [Penicillium atrosanguineum]